MQDANFLKPLLLSISVLLLNACNNLPFSNSNDRPILARVRQSPIYVDEFKREYLRQKIGESSISPIASDQNTQKKTLLDENR